MNIKKFLEKAAEEDRESQITERDKEFLSSIGVDYNKKAEIASAEPEASYYLTTSAFNYKAFLIPASCFILVVVIIALSLYFSLKPAPIEQPIQYFDDNFVSVVSDLQELNADLELFSLTVDEGEYDLIIKKTYDSVSGDNLFYSLEFVAKQSNKKVELHIVVNKFYTHNELSYTGDLVEFLFSGYTLKYYEISDPVPDMPFVTVECAGEMQIGEQWIYIAKYQETAFGQSTFIETLQSLISFK